MEDSLAKERLDILLIKRGLFDSREKAKAVIMSGNVLVENIPETKPGTMVNQDSNIRIKGNVHSYVSRGGLKLEKALKVFNIRLEDKKCIDIGASTGGFTDCMLQNGAKQVVAIDVGYGQLAWKLRNDSRVISMERTNIRNVTLEMLPELSDFASIDVSFISLKKVIPTVLGFLHDKAELVCLIKPQFEAGKDKVGKKGVVRDWKVHEQVVMDIAKFCIDIGLSVKGIDFSPIKGPEGNIEFLIFVSKQDNELSEQQILKIVKQVILDSREGQYGG